jgi:hypothetical protein
MVFGMRSCRSARVCVVRPAGLAGDLVHQGSRSIPLRRQGAASTAQLPDTQAPWSARRRSRLRDRQAYGSVAELGDEVEAPAEGFEIARDDFEEDDLAVLDLGGQGDADAHPGGDLLWG